MIPSRPALDGVKVLCVDNESDILLGMETLLGRWGCDVRLAENASEAMQHLDEWLAPRVCIE